MPTSERVRKRVLRLRRYIGELKAIDPKHSRLPSFEEELSRLVTGKQPSCPVGVTVGVKLSRKRKK